MKGGRLTFVLINICTQPKAAVRKIGALDDAVKWASKRFVGERNILALGHFNASCDYAKPRELDALTVGGPP